MGIIYILGSLGKERERERACNSSRFAVGVCTRPMYKERSTGAFRDPPALEVDSKPGSYWQNLSPKAWQFWMRSPQGAGMHGEDPCDQGPAYSKQGLKLSTAAAFVVLFDLLGR